VIVGGPSKIFPHLIFTSKRTGFIINREKINWLEMENISKFSFEIDSDRRHLHSKCVVAQWICKFLISVKKLRKMIY